MFEMCPKAETFFFILNTFDLEVRKTNIFLLKSKFSSKEKKTFFRLYSIRITFFYSTKYFHALDFSSLEKNIHICIFIRKNDLKYKNFKGFKLKFGPFPEKHTKSNASDAYKSTHIY